MIWSFCSTCPVLTNGSEEIQVAALVIDMGFGLASSVSYSPLVTAGFVTDPEVLDTIFFITGTYVAAILFSQYWNRSKTHLKCLEPK